MLGKTHRAFAFATSAAVLVAVHSGIQTEEIALGHSLLLQTALHTGAILSSTAPDIDQGFGLGQHRGISHSIWIVLLLAYITYRIQAINTYVYVFGVGCVIGYLSHLIGDAFSIAGIAWFYPIQRYERYASGAFYVKGFRGPFIPLYHVGDKTFSFMPILWWMIGCGLWIAAIWQIFNRCVITW